LFTAHVILNTESIRPAQRTDIQHGPEEPRVGEKCRIAGRAAGAERDQRPRIALSERERAYDILRLVMGTVTGALPASIPLCDILRWIDEIGLDHETAIGTAGRFVPWKRWRQIQATWNPLLSKISPIITGAVRRVLKQA
jgi:hypothetical protein